MEIYAAAQTDTCCEVDFPQVRNDKIVKENIHLFSITHSLRAGEGREDRRWSQSRLLGAGASRVMIGSMQGNWKYIDAAVDLLPLAAVNSNTRSSAILCGLCAK